VSLLIRIALYLPILWMIAIVVCGQHHSTARATLQEAFVRTGRWLLWTAGLLVVMFGIERLLIGW
jgi:threonine/homoserine/homoserine lactone efflux protein